MIYLYLLWSKKATNKQYLGSSGRTPRERLLEQRRDIMNGMVDKVVPQHFNDKAINEYNLVEVGG